MEDSVTDYLLRLVTATRNDVAVRLGVSTRGSLQFARMARAHALLRGRDYVLPEDIKRLAEPVLAHRLVLDTRAKYSGTDKQTVIAGYRRQVPSPPLTQGERRRWRDADDGLSGCRRWNMCRFSGWTISIGAV